VLAWLLLLVVAGCQTPSSYRSSSLRINAVPNRFTSELTALQAPKVEEDLNQAFISDGRFAQGSGLVLGVEVTSFQAPRSAGTQQYADQLAGSYRFLPGIIVVSARFYDDRQNKLEQVDFAENIMPAPGEVTTYAAVNRAIRHITQRIMDYTTDRYLAPR
jgi:hypothetical protein